MAGCDNNNGGVVVEETASSSSSAMSKVKFMCSHGGRILPRSTDGQLKYVGGETRVIAIPRNISFSELMKKLTALFDRDMVLKYQVRPEDLDALVSVRADEDLKHMLDEHDRHESEGNPKLRAFLFPSNPTIIENQGASIEPHVLEQRYVDAINGVIRTAVHSKHTSINTNKATFSISSGCSSPHSNSPEGQNVDNMIHESNLSNGYQNDRVPMHKVRSSPSLCSLNNSQQQSHSSGNHHFYQHHQHYHPNHQHHPHHGYNPRSLLDPHRGVGVGDAILTRNWSLGRADGGRSLLGHGLNPHYPLNRHHRESGTCISCGYYDEFGARVCARMDRSGSLPRSRRKVNLE
uniref:PB1 domain-containing protein n=1 Tax=Fagus sylvatica TaxID=28930 RepID=A0A2N9EW77_FAGSY